MNASRGTFLPFISVFLIHPKSETDQVRKSPSLICSGVWIKNESENECVPGKKSEKDWKNINKIYVTPCHVECIYVRDGEER